VGVCPSAQLLQTQVSGMWPDYVCLAAMHSGSSAEQCYPVRLHHFSHDLPSPDQFGRRPSATGLDGGCCLSLLEDMVLSLLEDVSMCQNVTMDCCYYAELHGRMGFPMGRCQPFSNHRTGAKFLPATSPETDRKLALGLPYIFTRVTLVLPLDSLPNVGTSINVAMRVLLTADTNANVE
jgi:hypothetical protein